MSEPLTMSQAGDRLGKMWAIEHGGGLKKFNPAFAALLVELATMLINNLMTKCNETPMSLHEKAQRGPTRRHKKVLGRWMRRKMGWMSYQYNGGSDLVESAVSTMANPESLPCCKVMMGK